MFEPRIKTSISLFTGTLISHTAFIGLFKKFIIP